MANNYCIEKTNSKSSPSSCLTGLQEEFTAKVNWNENPLFGIGCYKEDQIWPKHTVEMKFKKYESGDIRIKFGQFDSYILTQDGQLKEITDLKKLSSIDGLGHELRKPIHIPAKFSGGAFFGFRMAHYKANETFYKCYQFSTEQNLSLTNQQKEVVDKFFAAVKTTFPQEYIEK